MWEPQHLRALWLSTARYRDTFTFTFIVEEEAKQETNVKTMLATLADAGFFLGLFFDPEAGGNMFLQKVG
jgi:hypothetical protein